MFKIFKRTLQMFIGVALVMQVAGCFFVDRDHGHDRHYDHPEHHDDHGHDSGIDVHLHG